MNGSTQVDQKDVHGNCRKDTYNRLQKVFACTNNNVEREREREECLPTRTHAQLNWRRFCFIKCVIYNQNSRGARGPPFCSFLLFPKVGTPTPSLSLPLFFPSNYCKDFSISIPCIIDRIMSSIYDHKYAILDIS
ncbi:hypothetical protein Pfo_008854 [Paulownia fortunei]|nr:hypothetical protein Pfo_008854 [Paulownia fortunei]